MFVTYNILSLHNILLCSNSNKIEPLRILVFSITTNCCHLCCITDDNEKRKMITIIAGTNRQDSMTLRTARAYYNIIASQTPDVQILSLLDKQVWERGSDMKELESKYLIPATKFLFIMPEYNASFPGVLKMMIDNSDIKKCWWYKKAALVGISDGRAGNLRGTEHMTAILNYMKVNVLYNKLLLSKIKEEINLNSDIIKPETQQLINIQVEELLKF